MDYRLRALPNLPTLQEQGQNSSAIPERPVRPAKPPPHIVNTLNAALNKALDDPATKRLEEIG
jgi:tripartite-type tricarboxylate transporter receptor subunit TctC